MAPVIHPLINLVYNDETGRYIAVLERKLLHYILEDAKMRALLELLTGKMWDDQDFRDMADHMIKDIAVDALKKRGGMSEGDARALVAQRWNDCNPPPPNPATVGRVFAGQHPGTKTPIVASVARPMKASAPYDHQKHLAGLSQAHANRAATDVANIKSALDLARERVEQVAQSAVDPVSSPVENPTKNLGP